jgi:hypothetical protein
MHSRNLPHRNKKYVRAELQQHIRRWPRFRTFSEVFIASCLLPPVA